MRACNHPSLRPFHVVSDADLNSWLIYYCVRRPPMLSLIPDAFLDVVARYPATTTINK